MEKGNFKELEYKYKADEVSLVEFNELMRNVGFKKKLDVSSWDIYYTKESEPDRFVRFRMSTENPELTKKRKTKDSNNWERVEVDLPLDPDKIKEDIVANFVELDGYKKNFKIYKSCFIYFFDDVNTVWYSVYDENMKEQGRFIEIEVNKHKIDELGEDYKKVLKDFEEKMSVLGISHQNRLKKSLFEMFAK